MSAAIVLPSTMRVFERGWLSSNNILFTGPESALVDSGYVAHAAQTQALVAHALGGRSLERLINTHLHSDHCGGNALLQQTYGCHTVIAAAEADAVRDWDQAALSFAATGQECARFGFDATLAPGDVLELGGMAWQVLAAPGHDAHALLLYCADERILISADALWEQGFGIVFPEVAGEPGFADVRATLNLIAGLDVRLVIPGHGAPFTDMNRALETAFSRLDYLAADPERNARNAVKALVKFLLLARQAVPLDALPALLTGMPLVIEANRRYLRLPLPDLAQWVASQLVRAEVAAIGGGMLHNRGN